jgi:glycine cleavage system regulatory protein
VLARCARLVCGNTVYFSEVEAAVPTSLVLTVIGEDKPGIVEHIADLVLAAGANWEESRMARLAGRFAGILRVDVDSTRAAQLESALRNLESRGLRIVVESGTVVEDTPVRVIRLEVVGHDRPGIVRDISRVLAERGINIEELETEVTSAPDSGDTLFRARARLAMPPAISIDTLRTLLESLALDLMVDVTVEGPVAAAE